MKPDSAILKKIIKVSCLALELLLSNFLRGDILKAVDGTLNVSTVIS
jgi:hypothetical protein